MKGCGTQDLLQPIRWLIGRWRSVSANIVHPTIQSVDYVSEMKLISTGILPNLVYSSIARHAIDKHVFHYETGLLRLKENTFTVFLYYVQNKNLMSLEQGKLDGKSLHLTSRNILPLPLPNETKKVTKIERYYKLRGKKLSFKLLMETLDTPLTEYLNIVYEKEGVCDDEK